MPTSRTLWSHFPQYSGIAFGALAAVFLVLTGLKTFPSTLQPTTEHTSGLHLNDVSGSRLKSLQPILNSTLGFERILAINLPERTDHHDGLVLASVVSNFKVDFVDGVHGEDIPSKALPPVHSDNLKNGTIGAWRAHINAISKVVENGWSSVLILEDDVDWDVRIRQQLREFALGSDYVLRHPGSGSEAVANSMSHSNVPQTSPYGEGWDVLWLGHCGMSVAQRKPTMIFENDVTVPETDRIGSWNDEQKNVMKQYPSHSRIVTEEEGGTCSLAYAISQQGARALLFENGLRQLTGPFDLMLREFCEGYNGHSQHKCISVLPQLFDHHRRRGPLDIDSDITTHEGPMREKAFTKNIRWSVRLNMAKILRGDTDYDDQFPDTVTNEN